MKNPLTKKTEPNVDTNLAAVHLAISNTTPGTPEYKILIDQAKVLADIKALNKAKISPDGALNAAASLLGIGMVLHFEKFNVLASKAVGFIRKV